jgi:hypothetical protein
VRQAGIPSKLRLFCFGSWPGFIRSTAVMAELLALLHIWHYASGWDFDFLEG